MNGVQTRLKCKPNVKRCKRFVFAAHSPLLHPNTLKTKAISHFQTDHILTRFVFPPLMVYDKGTCLLVEGLSLEIVDDSSWKKPEEIKKEIREKYQDYRTEKGHEPHFLECIIRWNDTLETLETRIALDMDSDTEMDDEIFFYCDTLDCLLSLADKSGEDFVIAGCFGFGEYKEI